MATDLVPLIVYVTYIQYNTSTFKEKEIMAYTKPQTTKNPKLDWARYVYENYMRDIAQLQQDWKELDEKCRFTRGEALHHQTELVSDTDKSGIYGPSNGELVLPQQYTETLKKRKEAQEMVSVSGISKVRVSMEQVETAKEGSQEEEVEEPDEQTNKIRDGSVVKLFQVEGKSGNIAFATDFSSFFNPNAGGGKIYEIHNMQCSSKEDLVNKIIHPGRLLVAQSLQDITFYLSFLQILQSEREEVLNQLELDIPNLTVEQRVEPMIIIVQLTRKAQIKIKWNIIWVATNERLRYDISVSCKDEVADHYIENEQVYPYLSGEKQLYSCEDVVSFVEGFEF
ncbi:hypothetical protein Pcinc_025136 [Petrolisthes cinctipes]|uniref:Uncharacterized protein n=1 Tax=Petrolisthes cinctipes TaxID=88211 RepID=A0AAE1FAL1_PETCI|nr:hypothetical protein Pcinc_025136 [Petrolisthes cinctipes]